MDKAGLAIVLCILALASMSTLITMIWILYSEANDG